MIDSYSVSDISGSLAKSNKIKQKVCCWDSKFLQSQCEKCNDIKDN